MLAGSSTAEAVRQVAAHDGPWAALGNRAAAERYGCHVLRAGVEDVADNETRFVWLGPAGAAGGAAQERGGPFSRSGPGRPRSCSGAIGSEAPGWLVGCLAEFASRDVNLTRIESRPRKQGLGRYMFFCDLEGRDSDPRVDDALEGLRGHVERLRVLGHFRRPEAPPRASRRSPATLPRASHGLHRDSRAIVVRAASPAPAARA